MLGRKPKLKSSNEKVHIVCYSDGQSKLSKEQLGTTCTRNSRDKNCQSTKYSKFEYDDLKSQSKVCSDNNCQETQNIHM